VVLDVKNVSGRTSGRTCVQTDKTSLFHVDFMSFLQRTHNNRTILEKCFVVAFSIEQMECLVFYKSRIVSEKNVYRGAVRID
jgi:hypothetical protein